jgi:hypothetical protein
MTMDRIDPAEGIRLNVLNATQNLDKLSGETLPTDLVSAVSQAAQVQATLALVHAVRELTERLDPQAERTTKPTTDTSYNMLLIRLNHAEQVIRALHTGESSPLRAYQVRYEVDLEHDE